VGAGEAGAVGQAGGGVVADRFHEHAAPYPHVAAADHVVGGQDGGVVREEELERVEVCRGCGRSCSTPRSTAPRPGTRPRPTSRPGADRTGHRSRSGPTRARPWSRRARRPVHRVPAVWAQGPVGAASAEADGVRERGKTAPRAGIRVREAGEEVLTVRSHEPTTARGKEVGQRRCRGSGDRLDTAGVERTVGVGLLEQAVAHHHRDRGSQRDRRTDT